MELTFNQYAKKARETATYDKSMGASYSVLGLCGESGEVADKIKKILRDKDGKTTPEDIKEIAAELGDVLWYIANMCYDLGISMESVAEYNLTKLYRHKQANTIHGNGDNR